MDEWEEDDGRECCRTRPRVSTETPSQNQKLRGAKRGKISSQERELKLKTVVLWAPLAATGDSGGWKKRLDQS